MDPRSAPNYPSIDQYQQGYPQPPGPPGRHDQGFPPNQYNQNYPNYPPQQPNQPFYNPNAYPQQPNAGGGGGQLFNDLGLISGAFNNPMGVAILQNANEYMGSRFKPYLNWSPFKYYFNVNNSYVFNKIKLLLCPFLHKSWKRRIGRFNEVDSYVPPREDINAPDLYIPAMAYVTYILLVGFVFGTALKFTPEVLGVTATSGFLVLAFELLLIKTGFYLLNCGSVAIYDLTAYCGYKFVGVVFNIVAGLLGGSYLYYAVTFYTGVCMAIFMVRTLRIVLTLEQGGLGGIGGGGVMQGGFAGPGMGMGPGTGAGMVPGTGDRSMSRNYFLLIVAVLQVFLVYLLSAR